MRVIRRGDYPLQSKVGSLPNPVVEGGGGAKVRLWRKGKEAPHRLEKALGEQGRGPCFMEPTVRGSPTAGSFAQAYRLMSAARDQEFRRTCR